MAGRSMFVMGIAQDPFRFGFRMGQSGFDSLPPERKAELIEAQLDEASNLHGRIFETIKKYGGLGDRLKAALGPDYDAFVIAYYGQSALADRAEKLYAVVGDPEAAAGLDASDQQTIIQWKKALLTMEEMLAKHDRVETGSSLPTALAVGGLAAAGLAAYFAFG